MQFLSRGAVCLLLLLWSGITIGRVSVWGDPRRLWAEAVEHSPEKPRPAVNYAVELTRVGAEDLAHGLLLHALAAGVTPRRVTVEGPMRGIDTIRLNLAIWYAQRGEFDNAIELTSAIQDRRGYAGGGSLVSLLERQWRIEQAHPSSGFSGY